MWKLCSDSNPWPMDPKASVLPTTPQRPTKSDVGLLHQKKWLLPCYILNVCLYAYMLQKLALWSRVIKPLSNSLLQEYYENISHKFIGCYNSLMSAQFQLSICAAAAYSWHSQILQAFVASDNHLCSLFETVAVNKLNSLLTSFSVKSTSQLVNKFYDLS